MRCLISLGSIALIGAAVFASSPSPAAEPVAKSQDPWTGTYLKFGEYESDRSGQFGEVPKITITKEGDVYKLGKPYDHSKFREISKSVLEDDPGGIGTIKLGSMAFSDGTVGRILRADFCYETFYLAERPVIGKKATGAVEKKTPAIRLEEGAKLVRDFIFTANPKMNPAAYFPLKDLTTKAVWDRLGVQVFQVTEGVQACETFVIKSKKVYRIGRGFGGPGVTSLAVADGNGDRRDKLVYAYGWGSGDHRSQVAVFDCLAKETVEVVAPQWYVGGPDDLAVKTGDGQKVEVYAGKQPVGRLIIDGKDGQLTVGIEVNGDLPEDIRKNLRTTRGRAAAGRP